VLKVTLRRDAFREAAEVQRPAVAGVDALAQALPTVEVAVEVAMLEFDAPPGAYRPRLQRRRPRAECNCTA
jgi:hypothetical protein